MPARTVTRQHPAYRDDIADLRTVRPLPGPDVEQIDPFLGDDRAGRRAEGAEGAETISRRVSQRSGDTRTGLGASPLLGVSLREPVSAVSAFSVIEHPLA